MTFLAIVDSSTGCVRAVASQRPKGAADDLASSVADFVKKLARWKVQTALRPRTFDHGGGRESEKAKMPDKVVVENSASNGLAERAIRTLGQQLRTLRCDTPNRCKTRITPDSVRYAGFCVTRYARGAGDITPFRAAYDQDYTQEIVPFAENVLFKILASKHRGLSLGKRLHCVERRDLVRNIRSKPRAHFWDKDWRHGRENNPKAGADETSRNLIVARGTRSALEHGTERTTSWETQETPGNCTSLTTIPRKPDR